MSKMLRLIYNIIIIAILFLGHGLSQSISQVELENSNQVFVVTILPAESIGNNYIRIYSDDSNCSVKPVKVLKNNRPLWFKMIIGEFSNEINVNRIEIQSFENAIILKSEQLGNDNFPVQLECVVSGKVGNDFELKIDGMENPKSDASTSIKSIKINIKNKIQE